MGLIIIPPPDDGSGGETEGPVAAYAYKLAGAVGVDAPLELKLARLANLTDAFQIADTLDQVLTIIVEVSESFTADDSLQLTSQLIADVSEAVNVYGLFKTMLTDANGNPIDDGFATWVMNTEAARPISQYDNYNFNSLAFFKDQLYGTADDGLYTLSGADDAGSTITAELKSMMLDFGTSRMKRVRSAYMGYTASGDLVLKVRAVSDGTLSEHWFKARQVENADAPREGYVKVGQGLKSRYWQFELTNVDGADFEVDHLELYPLLLGRRV